MINPLLHMVFLSCDLPGIWMQASHCALEQQPFVAIVEHWKLFILILLTFRKHLVTFIILRVRAKSLAHLGKKIGSNIKVNGVKTITSSAKHLHINYWWHVPNNRLLTISFHKSILKFKKLQWNCFILH